jgi:hypothetical protein
VPTEEEGRQARVVAERDLRETQNRWPTIHEISTRLERVRKESGPDPFVDGLERAMRPRPRRPRGEP